jgi:PKD repeat protein
METSRRGRSEMRGRYILLLLALALICAACASGTHRRAWSPWTIVVKPEIVSMLLPTVANSAGTSFTVAAETSGSLVVSWEWDFGGGADPNTSANPTPTVILVNASSTVDKTYTCTLTVRDAQGNSDTMSEDYVVGRRFVEPAVFVDLPSQISGNFSFRIYEGEGNPVEITLEVTSGEGVTVEPTNIYATSEDYGPFNITVTSHNIEDTAVEIAITLDNGEFPEVGYVSGVIPGIQLPVSSV